MAEETAISWTDSTFNPWWGCTKVSAACDFWRRTSPQNWSLPRKWQRQAEAFEAEHGRRRRVFCASMADVFDNQVPDEWRTDLWSLIQDCDRLDWMLLTKRPQNILKMLPANWGFGWLNVWLGFTAENQIEYDRRWPSLSEVPARIRFISYEPALGPLHLGAGPKPDWVIAGGESGVNARQPAPAWFRALRDQCASANVPYHFKQWGGRTPKANGRLLDGREHNGFPASAA